MRFALIEGGRVATVVDQASQPTIPGQWVASGNAGPGWGYDGSTFTEPPPAPRKVTRLAFRNRFTAAEKAAIEFASLDNPSVSQAARLQAAGLRATLADQAQATFIDLERPDTRAGVQGLEALTLIGSGRALAILDAPIEPGEAL